MRLSFHDSGTYDVDGSGGRPDGKLPSCLLKCYWGVLIQVQPKRIGLKGCNDPLQRTGIRTVKCQSMSLAGCLLLDDADNGGIAEIKAIVEDIYLEYQSVISRADFWALSANVAMGEAFPNGANLTCC